ncbi:MAG TPA: STAS domain-containing protein [Steroidobacteraceae bacterium]|nr:STAS domain-containing protein [Steroidobacteraceae bacterium]
MEAGALEDLGAGRFALSGDLVFATVAPLLAAGDAAFASLAEADVDLSGVGRVDSAGLALLLEWSVSGRATGRAIRYRNAPEAMRTLARIGEVEALLTAAGTG